MSVHDFDWMALQERHKEGLVGRDDVSWDPTGWRPVRAPWLTYRDEDTIDPVIRPRMPIDGAIPVCRPFEYGGNASDRSKRRDGA